jgi:BTB/POZ domain
MTAAILHDADFGYCVDDTVVFKVEITVYGDLETASFPAVGLVSASKLVPSLGRCLKQLYLNGDLTDAELVVSGNPNACIATASTLIPAPSSASASSPPVRIRVHRAILAARSPVFLAMFSHTMTERSTGIITVNDVEPLVMQEMVHFMYTDECTDPMVMDNMAEALLCAACKYQIAALIAACEVFLCNHITVETAVPFLRLADLLELSKMKDQLLSYIAHHAPEVSQTKDFACLDGDLKKEMMTVLDSVAKRKGCRGSGESSTERRFISQCGIM